MPAAISSLPIGPTPRCRNCPSALSPRRSPLIRPRRWGRWMRPTIRRVLRWPTSATPRATSTRRPRSREEIFSSIAPQPARSRARTRSIPAVPARWPSTFSLRLRAHSRTRLPLATAPCPQSRSTAPAPRSPYSRSPLCTRLATSRPAPRPPLCCRSQTSVARR